MKRSLPSLEEAVLILRTTHTKRVPRTGPPVSKQVQPLLKSLQAKFEAADDGSAKLKGRWAEIVGESLSKVCEPVRIIRARSTAASPKAGALEVRVSGSFAAVVQHQSVILIDRVNLYLGGRIIDRLRIVQGPLSETPKKQPLSRPAPLNASEEVALQAMVADVGDEKLKKDLMRLGRAVMQRRKTNTGSVEK